MTLCGSARMRTVIARSSSESAATAWKRQRQPSSQRSSSSARVVLTSSNSESRSRFGFSPSELRKSVQRESRVPGHVLDEDGETVGLGI